MAELVRLKKHNTIPFLNIGATGTPKWARIGKSTVFDLVLNAQTEENNFIEDEMATTDVTRYAPSLAQELQCNKGDEAFDYLYNLFFDLPTGEAVKKELLIVFAGDIGTAGTPKFKAWDTISTLILDHFDSVAEKIYFSFNIAKITKGEATVSSGVPTFTATSAT
jgi:hypothetical protein